MPRFGLRYDFPEAAFERRTLPEGEFFSFSGQRPQAESGSVIQPRLGDALAEKSLDGRLLEPRGLLVSGLAYRSVDGFQPLIERAGVLGLDDRSRGTSSVVERQTGQDQATGLERDPPLPVLLGPLTAADDQPELLIGRPVRQVSVIAGQFDGSAERELVLRWIELEALYGDGVDREPPSIDFVQVANSGDGDGRMVIGVRDASGIDTVSAVCDLGLEEWAVLDLVSDAGGTWSGEIPVSAACFVQVADEAGNVAFDSNDARYFRVGDAVGGSTKAIYLPMLGSGVD